MWWRTRPSKSTINIFKFAEVVKNGSTPVKETVSMDHRADGKAKEGMSHYNNQERRGVDIIDYIGHALEPIPQQRKELLRMEGFFCGCN